MRMRTMAAMMGLLACAVATMAFWDKSPAEQRTAIQSITEEALNELYAMKPEAKEYVHRSVGYAVFASKGMKVLVAGGTSGKGMLVERKTGRTTYMEMAQANVGLGFGVQDARLIFVFENQEAINQFGKQGWDFSGQAGVSAAQKGQGANKAGALSFMPGVKVYQFTKNGLTAEITLQGTKFWPDKKLNE